MSAILPARSYAAGTFLVVAAVVASLFALSPSADAATRTQRVRNAVEITVKQKGDPYQYGAAGPNRFDCSGLVYYSYRRAGFTNIPRTSGAQARFAHRIAKKNMRRGDLMFFYNGSGVYHVGVYLGWRNGHRVMMHAPSTGKRVHRAKPWTTRWFAGSIR